MAKEFTKYEIYDALIAETFKYIGYLNYKLNVNNEDTIIIANCNIFNPNHLFFIKAITFYASLNGKETYVLDNPLAKWYLKWKMIKVQKASNFLSKGFFIDVNEIIKVLAPVFAVVNTKPADVYNEYWSRKAAKAGKEQNEHNNN